MAKNLLVINVDIRETRVALIENGIIAELHIERESSKGTLGNIYLGKVSRVLPGMQAAFIDVGLERAAFLHVEDLIRPDDFEAYLAGNRRGGAGTSSDEDRSYSPPPEAALEEAQDKDAADAALAKAKPSPDEAPVTLEAATENEEVLVAPGSGDHDDHDHHHLHEQVHLHEHEADLAHEEAQAEADAAHGEEPQAEEPQAEEPRAEAGSADVEPVAEVADEAANEGPGEGASAEGDAPAEASGAEGAVVAEDGSNVATPRARGRRSRSGRVRRSGRTTDRAVPIAEVKPVAAPPPPQQQSDRGGKGRRDGKRGDGRGRDGREGGREGRDGKRHANEPPRVSKTTPIREVVREGQEVVVQISKEPIGTKGARVTSHISLPGRYVVYLPTVEHIGISKRIGSERERSRLREAIDAMKPPTGGLIVRTLGEGLTKKALKADVGYLVRLWGEVAKKREEAKRAPDCLYTELDLVLKTARDLFTDDVEKIVIDSPEEHTRLKRFVEMFLPERAGAVELYDGDEPIFDAYGIEDEIQRAQSRKVPLHSGGYLIIDQAEALTAIDVNTGRFVGKGSKDLEETILTTNMEAVEEIAYQLRFRNIGGLIILDLIDMERMGNREKVRKKLEELLAKDKAKTTLNRISDLGLIEMTRKRTRESLGRMVLEPCFYCDGTGQLQSKQTIAYEILRQIRRERHDLAGYSVVVNAHPAVVDLLKSEERVAVVEAERLFRRRIELVARKEYHLEQFDLQGK